MQSGKNPNSRGSRKKKRMEGRGQKVVFVVAEKEEWVERRKVLPSLIWAEATFLAEFCRIKG